MSGPSPTSGDPEKWGTIALIVFFVLGLAILCIFMNVKSQ